MLNRQWKDTSTKFKARIIGKLLGDGGLKTQKNRQPRLQFNHKASDYLWTLYCYNKLKNYLPLNPPTYQKTLDSRLKKGYSETYYVQSRTSPIITFLYKEWYPNKKKILPINMLEMYFTAETLAWWFMDDGHFKVENHVPNKIILSTESFTDEEINWLIQHLKKTFHLFFSRDGQRR